MQLLLFYVALALGVSFLCSVMEAVLLSVSPSYVAHLEKEHPQLGRKLAAFKKDIDRPLAAILSLNTIAHTVGAAGAGAQAAVVWQNIPVAVISGVLTLLILVLSEIIPKTLGAVYWRQLTPTIVRILVPTIASMWPLVWLSRKLTKILRGSQGHETVSRDELTALAELGARQGVVDHGESRILKNLFRFGQILTRDIMTPRTVMFALPGSSTVAGALAEHPEIRFSRIPLYRNNRDDITGFALRNDLLLAAARGDGERTLAELERPIATIPATLPLRELFERLIDERDQVALVVDEYGGTAGLVSMEDVVETLLGLEIVDEVDEVRDMQELARRQWHKRAQKLGLVIEGESEAP